MILKIWDKGWNRLYRGRNFRLFEIKYIILTVLSIKTEFDMHFCINQKV